MRCDDCIAFHAKAAVERGATREEILETLGMAIYMGAGPSVMYASHALGAATQFAEAKSRARLKRRETMGLFDMFKGGAAGADEISLRRPRRRRCRRSPAR